MGNHSVVVDQKRESRSPITSRNVHHHQHLCYYASFCQSSHSVSVTPWKNMEKTQSKFTFLSITRFLFRARILFFLAWQQKKFFSPIGIFGTRNFTFWRGKSLLYLKKWHFRVNARHFSSFGSTKNLFCFSQACFGLQAVWGIFLAFRRPSAFFRPKNSQKQPSGQNNPAAAKKIFFLPHIDIVVHFTLIYTIST